MTDRTERNKVFSAKKVMMVVTLGLIFNYVFMIGIRLFIYLMWAMPNICIEGFRTNQAFRWLVFSSGVHLLIVTLFGLYTDVLMNR